MTAIQRKAVIREFETWLVRNRITFTKETPFKALFETKRQFRADYTLKKLDNSGQTDLYTLCEVNGGQHIQGRHNRGGKGYETDLAKLNLAASKGYHVFQYTYEMLARQEYINDLKHLI